MHLSLDYCIDLELSSRDCPIYQHLVIQIHFVGRLREIFNKLFRVHEKDVDVNGIFFVFSGSYNGIEYTGVVLLSIASLHATLFSLFFFWQLSVFFSFTTLLMHIQKKKEPAQMSEKMSNFNASK